MGNIAAEEGILKKSDLKTTVWAEDCKQQQIQRFFLKFVGFESSYEGA